jgi:hypothetical protein
MLDAQIMKKYQSSLEFIKASVNNGILPNNYLDLSHKWASDLGRLSRSVEARRAIDRTLEEIHTRQQQEDVNRRRGKYIGEWNRV